MANDPSRLASRRNVLAGTGSAAAIALAGCLGGSGNGNGNGETGGSGGGNGGSGGNGNGNGGGLSGTIDASGSNTVAPITSWAGENFQNEFPDVLVDVDPQGTGAGFQEFCRGNSDVQSASRLITDEEIGLCGDNDVNYDNIEVGLDGLAVVKNSENDWVDNITLDELEQIWTFESDVETWSDVRSEWPDREIALHARDSASGTFDYFTRAINGEIGLIRDDYSATSQTNEIMGAVANNVDAFGWGGVGYLRAIEDVREIEKLGTDRRTAFTLFRIARQLERIADHAELIADIGQRQSAQPDEERFEKFEEVATDARRVVRTALDGNTGEALMRRDGVIERLDELDRQLYEDSIDEVYLHGRVLESIRRTAEYGGNIAEIKTLNSIPTLG